MIKLAAVSLSALLVFAGSAMAADLMTQAPSAAPAASAYDWTGAYVGVNGGYGWGTLNYDPISLPRPAGSFDTSGWLGGLTAGYNYQTGQLVIGVEGDIDASSIKGVGAAFDPLSATPTLPSFDLNWLGTVRGRVGVAVDSFLIYGTAGVAVGGMSGGLTNVTGGGDDRTASGTQTGWVAGVGVEAAVAENITVKAEYLYTDLGTADYTFTGPYTDVIASVHPTASVARVGVNFKF